MLQMCEGDAKLHGQALHCNTDRPIIVGRDSTIKAKFAEVNKYGSENVHTEEQVA
jgi:hypothetical protein